ncbi:MAG: alpha/beta fold hydrolase [Bacteroidota bacterium]
MTPTLHQGQRVVAGGSALGDAQAAFILIHGRGASAESILGLGRALDPPAGLAFLAPQAYHATWYPSSFLAPLAQNEPWLSSALEAVGAVVQQVLDAGLPAERLIIGGFSQGACLSLEYAARHPQRYGGVVALSGGLIGNGERAGVSVPEDKTFTYEAALAGTPVFLGCSDIDPHIPEARVRRSAEVMAHLGADVDLRIYPGLGHTVNADELTYLRETLLPLVLD